MIELMADILSGVRYSQPAFFLWNTAFRFGFYIIVTLLLARLKQALEHDGSWSDFVEKAHRFKQQVSLTPLAALAPPQQRSKARWMNLDVNGNIAIENQNQILLFEARGTGSYYVGLSASSSAA